MDLLVGYYVLQVVIVSIVRIFGSVFYICIEMRQVGRVNLAISCFLQKINCRNTHLNMVLFKSN